MDILWFKHDLRICNHAALTCASQSDAVLPIYILEPELWKQPNISKRHYIFLNECLQRLDEELKK
ncbi:MAG: deoxyribodipyrimidine photo-lyase [Candidatus Paracaedibacteraceae bacterium]|nr:deoxyribodipyrimidine photo-lyase [Candidatus Paracaedibacteraceae bacterium]